MAHRLHLDLVIIPTYHQVQAYCRMIRERRGHELDTWITGVQQTGVKELCGFVRGLLKDAPAGRAAFITGQYPTRVGLSTVGLPGLPLGLQKEDPTLAELLKPMGYTTGQFGKNHLGDRDEHLPTAHGFDEFFGILYHLNAGEYVELYDFPKDPQVAKRFGQRSVLHAWANAAGTQRIEDMGRSGGSASARSTPKSSPNPSASSAMPYRAASRSSSGTTPRVRTTAPTSRHSMRARVVTASTPTA